MNLAELTSIVAQGAGISKSTVREIIKLTTQAIQLEVVHGGRVSLVGFGSFHPTLRRARTGRNPQTGGEVKIPAATVPRFKAGKEFRDLVRTTPKKRKA